MGGKKTCYVKYKPILRILILQLILQGTFFIELLSLKTFFAKISPLPFKEFPILSTPSPKYIALFALNKMVVAHLRRPYKMVAFFFYLTKYEKKE